MQIINTNWSWAYGLGKRTSTTHIILHHAAAKTLSPAALHAMHKQRGFSGFGYHFYVRKSGAIYRGRPIWAAGAQCGDHNSHTIGICAEGNYDVEKDMPQRQLQALQWLVQRMKRRYPKAKVVGHKYFHPTACPGRHYPMAAVKKGLTTGNVVKLPVPSVKPAWWKKVVAWIELTK